MSKRNSSMGNGSVMDEMPAGSDASMMASGVNAVAGVVPERETPIQSGEADAGKIETGLGPIDASNEVNRLMTGSKPVGTIEGVAKSNGEEKQAAMLAAVLAEQERVALMPPVERFYFEHGTLVEAALNLTKDGEQDPKTERDLFSSFAVFSRASGYSKAKTDKGVKDRRQRDWQYYRGDFLKAFPTTLELEGEQLEVIKIGNGKIRHNKKTGVPEGETFAVTAKRDWTKEKTASYLEKLAKLNAERE